MDRYEDCLNEEVGSQSGEHRGLTLLLHKFNLFHRFGLSTVGGRFGRESLWT